MWGRRVGAVKIKSNPNRMTVLMAPVNQVSEIREIAKSTGRKLWHVTAEALGIGLDKMRKEGK